MAGEVCERCGNDWAGAPGHPRAYCDEVLLRQIAAYGCEFLEQQRACTGVSYMRFKEALERFYGHPIPHG